MTSPAPTWTDGSAGSSDASVRRLTRQAIRQWYMDAGFEEVAFDSEDGFLFGVGTARLTVPPPAYVPDRHLFDFVGP